MLEVHQVSKSYGVQAVLDEVTFVVNSGERVGLIGPNGCGKTTLLRIIAGLQTPDRGHVRLDPAASPGYLPQQPDLASQRTLLEEVRAGIQGLETAQEQVERLAEKMAAARGEALEALMAAYGESLTLFESLGGYAVEHRAREILTGLGLEESLFESPVSRLSGGQRVRVGLARLLIARPTLLLLDEPTNHLDIEALEWLESTLASFTGAAVIVSHDRTFLDRTVGRILELDPLTHRITSFPGNYTAYAMTKDRDREQQWARWRDQQAEIRRLKTDIRRTKDQARRTETGTKNDHLRRLAKKVARKAKARERRLERYLDSTDRAEKPQTGWQMKLAFDPAQRSGQMVLNLEGVGHAFGDNRLFDDLDLSAQHGERIALTGPNGSGKTTLLRIITGELTPARGSVRLGASVQPGYMPQTQESLPPDGTPVSILRQVATLSEVELRSFLHYFLFSGDDVFTPAARLSAGERTRLLLAILVASGANFLVLDEPINHLDIPSRDRFLSALEGFPGTVLVAVHDRSFIQRYSTTIWSLKGGKVEVGWPERERR